VKRLDPAVRHRLYVRRFALGLSQRQLASRMGTSQSEISNLEKGMHDPGIDTLTRWAEALGLRVRVSIDDVWESDEKGAA
jgi:transcriptional regulator with XRE-family HTH domain